MSRKAVVLRGAASEDIRSAIAYYREEASDDVALRLVERLEQTLTEVSEQPALGSPRFAHDVEIPGLRSRLVADFPYAVFYIETDTNVQVWRVLHTRQDLGSLLDRTEI